MLNSPLEQFKTSLLKYLFKLFEAFGVPFDTFVLFSLVATFLMVALITLGLLRARIVPTFAQVILEGLYDFVYGFVVDTLGIRGARYFPFIFFLFLAILWFNLFGLFPFSFTITAQVVVVCFFSFTTFVGVLLIGLVKHKLNFLSFFFPAGAPFGLAWLLVPIEIVSFFSRPFSLAIRLFANLTAGHVLLKILASFILYAFFSFISNLWVPLIDVALGGRTGLTLQITFLAAAAPVYSSLTTLDIVAGLQYLNSLEHSALFLSDLFRNVVHSLRMETSFEAAFQSPSSFVSYLETLLLTPAGGTGVSFYLDSFLNKLVKLSMFQSAETQIGGLAAEVLEEFQEIRQLKRYDHFIRYIALSSELLQKDYFNLFTGDLWRPFPSLTFAPEGLFNFRMDFFLTWALRVLSVSVLLFITVLFILVLSIFILLELFVAALQAYVFAILSTIYIRDVLDLH